MKTSIATHADIPRLCDFVNRAYRGDSSRQGWTTEADLLEGQRTDPDSLYEMMQLSLSESKRNAVILKLEMPELVGCVYLRKDPDSAYLGMLTVNPQLQNSGLGKKLLEQAEFFCQTEWSSQKMHMRVISSRRELIQWYERRGYQIEGQIEPWPYGDLKFGIPKTESLSFSVLTKSL